jgi:hypothetical protein
MRVAVAVTIAVITMVAKAVITMVVTMVAKGLYVDSPRPKMDTL